MKRIVPFLACMALPIAATAHPLAPALLQLQEQAPGTYAVLWRTSVARTAEGEVWPLLPRSCETVGEPDVRQLGNSAVEQTSTIRCQHGLAGEEISVSNLDATGINVVVRIERSGGAVANGLLDAAEPVYRVPAASSPASTVADYFSLGVRHLLKGLDHLLFIAGLVLLVVGGLRLVGTVTAFTLGHSLTLGLATLGFVEVNAALVEAGIALSLIVLATELVRPDPESWIRRRPWDMALAFGLLHGLGFAGALTAAGLPAGAIPAALLGFNLGIEAGQLAVALVLLGAVAVAHRFHRDEAVRGAGWAHGAAAYAMGSLGAFWLYERLAAAVV